MSFQVKIKPSQHQFTVEPGETLLDAALRQDIALPYGCRGGRCGSCLATLAEGVVAYPDDQTEALNDQPETSVLTCQAVPQSDLVLQVHEIEGADELEVRLMPARVERVERLADDVIRMHLKLPDDQRLQFLAGQYLDFILEDGRKRAFSIANAPHDDELIELHIRHVPGGEFTDFVFNEMPEKSILRIEAPLGGFYLREDSDRPIIFMGGGTGFAPLKAMIEHAFHIGVERPMHLYWGVRSERVLYLPDLPKQWAAEHPNFSYTPVLSEPDTDWSGRAGFVHEAVVEDYPDLAGFDLYMSGPPVMINAAREAFTGHGLTMDHIYSDAFEYAKDQKKK